MAKFQMAPLIGPYSINITARIGDGAAGVNPLSDADTGKFVKMNGDSQYGLTALGDEIEGTLATADETGLTDGFVIGGVDDHTSVVVTLNGLQATPGVGNVEVGDFVVSDAPVARGTKSGAAPSVLKATAAKADLTFLWRLVAIKTGTGAPGSIGVISRV